MPADTDVALFDLDNTLIPFLEPIRRWARAWAREVRPGDPGPVREALLDAAVGEAGDTEQAARAVADRFDLADEAERATGEARRVYWRSLTPYPGIRAALARLAGAGLRLGVVTDAPRKRAAVRLSATQLARRFDVVVTRDDTPRGRGKASPRPFRMALDRLETDAGRAVMVGDWPAFDVRWPNRLGMRSVLARWGSPRAPEHARCSAEPWFEAEAPRELVARLLDGTPPEPARGPPTQETLA